MHPSNDKKRNRERNALGRLRTRRGVDFSWSSSSPIKTNEHLGRCHFDGFTLGKDKFVVGDMIRMETKYSPEAIYRIVSVFQATKSFSGIWHKGNWQEIQKRGMFDHHRFSYIMFLFGKLTFVLASFKRSPIYGASVT
jgi:hypothetical protein